MSTTQLPPSLTDIDIPVNLRIRCNEFDLEPVFARLGRREFLGKNNLSLFGTAFVQGSRLQFSSAMPLQKMLESSHIDQAKKEATVQEAQEHANRPKEKGHAKHLRDYLIATACAGEKFILPSFTFNYGVGMNDDAPDAELILFAEDDEWATTWPALLILPEDSSLETTDGAHRRGELEAILKSDKVSEDDKQRLKRNACDVKIVFESELRVSHQDFADCGKAKPITKSLVTLFDLRDRGNAAAKALIEKVPFLKKHVDATASNVNLSSRSAKAYSMSAIRMFVGHVFNSITTELDRDGFELDGITREEREIRLECEKMAGAVEFFEALVRHHPQLRALDTEEGVSTGMLRDVKGGNVALRAAGIAIFARAYLLCNNTGYNYDDMAVALAKLDWHVMSRDLSANERSKDFTPQLIYDLANPLWLPLLALTERRYKIVSGKLDIDKAWENVRAQLPSLISSDAAKAKAA